MDLFDFNAEAEADRRLQCLELAQSAGGLVNPSVEHVLSRAEQYADFVAAYDEEEEDAAEALMAILTAQPSGPVDREEHLDTFSSYPHADDFGDALMHLKMGDKVTRAGWNGKNMWLALQVPDAGSKMTCPYIYMRTVQGDLVPWLASQTDILANDWYVL